MKHKIIFVFKLIAISSAILLFLSICGVFNKQHQEKPLNLELPNKYQIQEEKYNPPIIPILIKDKQPIKDEYLPIPKKDIAKTITIETPDTGLGLDKFTLVISKEGDIYKTTDFPEDVQVKITAWKPRLFSIKPTVGYTLIIHPSTYHCLTLDMLRIYETYIGVDAGIHIENQEIMDYLLGFSMKTRIIIFKFLKTDIKLMITTGYDILNKNIYLGGTLKW